MTRARDLAAFVSNADGDIKFDTDTLFIDSSANRVAIGNTAPSRPLHITANPAMILLEDSDGGSDDKKAQIQVDGGAFEVNARNDDDSSRTDNILVADLGTGDVGIGTNNPQYGRLHISDGNSDIAMDANGSGQLHIDGNGYGFGVALNGNGAQIYTNSSTRDLIFGVNETEVARVTDDGITFNGDTAAQNALDDYEEGTWTPVVQGGTSSGTYTTQYILGRYTKIGARVLAETTIYVTGFNGTGDFQISGLPFSCKSSNPGGLVSAQWNSCPFATYSSDNQHVMGLIPANQSYIHFRASDRVQNGTHVQLQCGPSSITYLRLTISYEA